MGVMANREPAAYMYKQLNDEQKKLLRICWWISHDNVARKPNVDD
jgi:hypothetical protein